MFNNPSLNLLFTLQNLSPKYSNPIFPLKRRIPVANLSLHYPQPISIAFPYTVFHEIRRFQNMAVFLKKEENPLKNLPTRWQGRHCFPLLFWLLFRTGMSNEISKDKNRRNMNTNNHEWWHKLIQLLGG